MFTGEWLWLQAPVSILLLLSLYRLPHRLTGAAVRRQLSLIGLGFGYVPSFSTWLLGAVVVAAIPKNPYLAAAHGVLVLAMWTVIMLSVLAMMIALQEGPRLALELLLATSLGALPVALYLSPLSHFQQIFAGVGLAVPASLGVLLLGSAYAVLELWLEAEPHGQTP
jgi:hypothetical protein